MPEFKQNFAEIIQGKDERIAALEKTINRLNGVIDHMAGIQIKVLESLGYKIEGNNRGCKNCNGRGVLLIKNEQGKVLEAGVCPNCNGKGK